MEKGDEAQGWEEKEWTERRDIREQFLFTRATPGTPASPK